jgi:hypothetical protein
MIAKSPAEIAENRSISSQLRVTGGRAVYGAKLDRALTPQCPFSFVTM